MKLKHITELTDEDWYFAWNLMYDHEVNMLMGTHPDRYIHKPSLIQFYDEVMGRYNRGVLEAWVFAVGDRNIGQVMFERSQGEWEMGISIQREEDRKSGHGARAAIKSIDLMFDKGAPWIVAFSRGNDFSVPRQMQRIGFRKLYNYWVLDKPAWKNRGGEGRNA